MWEQIRANKRKSVLLVVLMACILVGLGYAIGFAVGGGDETALVGVAIAVIVWVILGLTAFAGGDSIVLATAGARRIEKKDLPQVYNIVEEMTIAAGLPRPPEVYLVDTNEPNAFAVGSPKRSAVAVTTGLVSRLKRDELQGVIAHEIGHIKNFDTRFIVLVGVMVGSIVLISDLFLRGIFYSSVYGRGSRRSGSGRDGNQAQAIMIVVAIVLAILAPILAYLIYFACSRKREYLADASSARFTRYPEGLASALEKITKAVRGKRKVSRVIAPMYIVNPLAAHGSSGLWSTHPPSEKRIKILRSMAGGAAYANYEKAYRQVAGAEAGLIGASSLTAEQGEVPIREATAEAEPPPAARRREAIDALHRKSGYRFAECKCGTRIKIPPAFQKPMLACPSCGRMVAVPAAGADATKSNPPTEPLRVRLAGKGWQSVQCSCGASVEFSPNFSGKRTRCKRCGRPIEIER